MQGLLVAFVILEHTELGTQRLIAVLALGLGNLHEFNVFVSHGVFGYFTVIVWNPHVLNRSETLVLVTLQSAGDAS